MKCVISIFILIYSIFSLADDRVFVFRHAGQVKYSNLEKLISHQYLGQDVEIKFIRRSILSFAFRDFRNQYVLSFRLNRIHEVTCDVKEIIKERLVFIRDCKNRMGDRFKDSNISYQDLEGLDYMSIY